MRRFFRILAVFVLALGVAQATGSFVGSGHVVHADDPPAGLIVNAPHAGSDQQLCMNWGNGGCIQPQGGTICDGCNVGVGSGNWHVDIYNSQISYKVCNGESGGICGGMHWPFTEGSGLNAKYDGDPVFEIDWHSENYMCLTSNDQWDSIVTDTECGSSTSKAQAWVQSGTWLINAGASNAAYAHGYSDPRQPMYDVTNASCTNGGGTLYVGSSTFSNCDDNWNNTQ